MPFQNEKYDLEINNVPYRVRNYSKSELSTFIPRISGGDQNESNFDLLRSKTIKSFELGILQRNWKEDSAVFGSEGLYPIYGDGVLYPTNTFSAAGILNGSKNDVMCKAVSKDYLFLAYRTYNSPANYITRIDRAGNVVGITLPAAVSNANAILDMVIWNNQLWVSVEYTDSATGDMHYMSLANTSLIKINGGYFYKKLIVFKNQLYGLSALAADRYSGLWRYTGDTTNVAAVNVGYVQNQSPSTRGDLLIFNNRILFTRDDGMFAYDGVQLLPIEDLAAESDPLNFRFPVALRGYLYYFMPDGWYRYNGSTIEKLYDLSEIGMPVDVIAAKGRIWMAFSNSEWTPSSRYDKSMGYDYTSTNNVSGRVMVFNGKALYTYARNTVYVKNPGLTDFSGQDENRKVVWFNNKLYVFKWYPKTFEHDALSTDETALTGTKNWRVVTSIYDGDFPMIDKTLENIEMTFDGTISSDQTITVEYRTAGFDGNTGWTALGNITTQNGRRVYTYSGVPAGITFRKIQLRFVGATTAGYGLEKIIIRTLLSPDLRWQWQFTVQAYGDDPLEPLQLADGSSSTQTVQQLRGNIYAARASDTPVKFLDVDQLDLNGAINNSTTTVVLNSTALLKGDEGFIQIDDEVMRYTARTATTLTVVRGQLGTAFASHADNAKVFPVYRVIVRQIQSERIQLADDGLDRQEDKSRASDLNIVVQEV